MDVYNLFGVNNPTGAAFLNLVRSTDECVTWGRRPRIGFSGKHIYCDLSNYSIDTLPSIQGIIISFAPIWLLANFLSMIYQQRPNLLHNVRAIMACSSSSYLTKRYAFNLQDQKLAESLATSHDKMKSLCSKLGITCRILAPTLIYGKCDIFKDQNTSKIIRVLRTLPFIALPKTCGLRQPIHATQLAAVANNLAKRLTTELIDKDSEIVLNIGGDDIISYDEMVSRIKESLDISDKGRYCKIIAISDTLFYGLSTGILPYNPKVFEGIMRIKSNLAGFTKAHTITNTEKLAFPVLPLPNR